MARREAPLQAQRRRTADRISKKWKIARQNKSPRGLDNQGNNCYRHGALQPLLHLPRFVNWILKHKKNGHWPCHAADPNKSLPEDELTQAEIQDTTKHTKIELYTGCVPCILKAFMKAYWGKGDTDVQPPYLPLVLPHHHDSVLPLHQLAERWFCRESQDLDIPKGSSRAERSRLTRDSKRAEMTAQQDADEFQRQIFGGIQSSYDHGTAPGQARHAEYDSLFTLTLGEVIECSQCGNRVPQSNRNDIGLSLIPRDSTQVPNASDTIIRAIRRALTDTVVGMCDPCGQNTTRNIRLSILAAPEYLRLTLNLYLPQKNTNPISIPDILDITPHMAPPAGGHPHDPVRYKLVSATYHMGTTNKSGHYTANVTGPRVPPFQPQQPQFFCDDARITRNRPTVPPTNVVTNNPYRRNSSRYDPVILYYERLPHVLPPLNRKTADQVCVEEVDEIRKNYGIG
ncbi:cysteine proteinase [Decorospora gaudefroyi]|uniref:Cysteine proteinase n=1 Tax=Decorospora gaudefroyi TaxID=184978 RepID=A0A6A5KCU0_9PLEO|nr:cysteine proteinase [Decorospora gaudefroyi]